MFLCVCTHANATQAVWYPVTHGADTGTPIDIQVLPQRAGNVLEIEVHVAGVFVSSFEAEDKEVYHVLDVPGMGAGAERVGYPSMPAKSMLVEIPAGVEVCAESIGADEMLLGDGFLIYPGQRAVPGEFKPIGPMTKSTEAYASNERFPSEIASTGKQSVIRGHHVIQLRIAPLQYVPSTGEVFAYRTMRITLRFSSSGSASMESPPVSTPEWDRLMEPFILNYSPSFHGAGEDGVRTVTGADYWVIVPDAFASAVQPLVEWKHRKGWKTHVTTLSEIGQNPDAEDIWQAINEAYTTWNPAPTYVLLVGDHDDLPPFTRDETAWQLVYVSDHEYALMDPDDEYYAPDLIVSRITTHSAQETAGVVQKILDYEIVQAQDPPAEWYRNFCTATYFDPKAPPDNDKTTTTFMETLTYIDAFLADPGNGIGMSSNTAWYNDTELPPPYYFDAPSYPHRPPIPATVPESIYSRWCDNSLFATAYLIQAVNTGISLLAYYEHGTPERWAFPVFSRDHHVVNLTNGEKLPVVISLACLTGRFNYANGDCLAEALLEKPDGGAVGVIASTEVSASPWNALMVHGIMDCFWPNYDTTTLHNDPNFPTSRRPAEALLFGKHYMQTYMYTPWDEWLPVMWHEYAYFGDPEMHIRTDTPKSIAATWLLYPAGSSYYLLARAKHGDNSNFAGVYCGVSNPNDDGEAFRAMTDSVGAAAMVVPQGKLLDMVFTSVDGIPYERVMGHCADTRAPFWQIDIDEVNRALVLYNSVSFHIDGSTKDCYAPGGGSYAGYYHHSDYNPADWTIDLDEILRLIQFYNSAGYTLAPESEDGFAPVSRGGEQAAGLDEAAPAITAVADWQGKPDNLVEVFCRIESDGPIPVSALGLAIELPRGAVFHGVVAGAEPYVSKADPAGERIEMVWVDVPPLPMTVTYRMELPAGSGDISEFAHELHYRTFGPAARTRFAVSIEPEEVP